MGAAQSIAEALAPMQPPIIFGENSAARLPTRVDSAPPAR